MLAEFLADRGDWAQVMPGARACLFSLEEGTFPLPLQLAPLHFETLFCLRGAVTLTRRDGSSLTAACVQDQAAQQITYGFQTLSGAPGVYRHENSFQRRIHAGPGQIGEIGETQHLPGASCQG